MVHLGVILINSNAHVFNEIPDKNTEAIYILENNDALSLWQIQSSQPISVFADFPGFLIRHTFVPGEELEKAHLGVWHFKLIDCLSFCQR